MKKLREMKKESWWGFALGGCITVAFYFLLARFNTVAATLKTLVGYFGTVIGGCVMAYLMNRLSMFFSRTLFKKVKKEKKKWRLSVILTIFAVLLFSVLLLLVMIPQLADSIRAFAGNLDGYAAALNRWLESVGLRLDTDNELVDSDILLNASESLVKALVGFVRENSDKVVDVSVTAGKKLVAFLISFILSMYFLLGKKRILQGIREFFLTALSPEKYRKAVVFVKHCDVIFSRYIVFNIIDSLIIGGINAVFMLIFGMPYIGLVSVAVMVTNLIPTFGPLIGAVIGGFVLLMADPFHALIFLIFTIVLQCCDAYLIKPRLFGDSLGVSGLLIMISVIIGGKAAGVLGILLATPFVAILDYCYRDIFFPRLRKRAERLKAEEEQESQEKPEAPEEE